MRIVRALRKKPFIDNFLVLLLLGISLSWTACTVGTAKKHYLLAEKFWTSGKYESAEKEFLNAIKRDPQGKIGHKALFRLAMTQTIFLNRHVDAIEHFIRFIEQDPKHPSSWSARLQIGEILYERLRKHSEAIAHYKRILREFPQSKEAPEIEYRIAKSHFYLMEFETAIALFKEIQRRYVGSSYAEKAAYEIGLSYFTGGGDESGQSQWFDLAIQSFQDFLLRYPDSPLGVEARFGIAACYEEMEQLTKAYELFAELRSAYTSPKVIDIRLARIQERMREKSK